jgi:inorganic triphosphatase YgiF
MEVELKYLATDAALADLARRERLGPAALGPASTAMELDRYLDTPDGRLAAARWACRLRTRGERTIVSLKGPPAPSGDTGVHRRPEIEGAATPSTDPADWPPSGARERLEALSAGARLVERLALRQERTERDLTIGTERVATLSLDRVTVLHLGEEIGRFASVELELAPEQDAGRWLSELREALSAVIGLRPDALSKLEHALALLDDAPA